MHKKLTTILVTVFWSDNNVSNTNSVYWLDKSRLVLVSCAAQETAYSAVSRCQSSCWKCPI